MLLHLLVDVIVYGITLRYETAPEQQGGYEVKEEFHEGSCIRKYPRYRQECERIGFTMIFTPSHSRRCLLCGYEGDVS